MLSETLVSPSPIRWICGTTGTKSVPGFAVPDSVHQVKLIAPCELPLRRTTTRALLSPAGTSTVAAATSMRAGLTHGMEGGNEFLDGAAAGAAAAGSPGGATDCAAAAGSPGGAANCAAAAGSPGGAAGTGTAGAAA